MPTPSPLDEPLSSDGRAITTTPAKPTNNPTSCASGGGRLAIIVATVATNNGVAPLSMPVTLNDTRSSANGNSVSGTASQTTPSIATRRRSRRSIGARAAGKASSVGEPEQHPQRRDQRRFERVEALGDEVEAGSPDHAGQRQAHPVGGLHHVVDGRAR